MTSPSYRWWRPVQRALFTGCLLVATTPAVDALPEVVATRGLPSSISSTYGTAVPLGDPSVAGLFAIPTGWGVEIRDAASGAAVPVGTFRTPGAVKAVAADGNTLYLFAGTRGIVAVDVTDPANPAAIGSRGGLGDLKLGAASPNGYGVSAANASELHFLGRASPGALSLLATLHYADGRIVRGIAARSDSFLVVSERFSPVQRLFLTLYRVPVGAAQPEFLSEIPVPNQAPTGFVWRGDLAFVGVGNLGVLVVNVRTGALPDIAGIGRFVRDVAANDTVVVAVAQAGTYARFSRGGPGGELLGSPTLESLSLEPVHVGLSGSRVVISAQDVETAQEPDEVGRGAIEYRDLDTPPAIPAVGGTGRTRRVAWSAGLAYVADYTGGLRIYRADGPDTSLVGVLPGATTRAVDIALDPPRNRAYLASGGDGLQVVDITDPAAPSLLASLLLPGLASAVAVADSEMVVVGRRGPVGAGLTFVDVSIPTAPSPRGQLGSGFIPEPRALAVKDTIAFVADELLGLIGVGFGNPDAPGVVGTFTGIASRDLDLAGNQLLVATRSAGLQLVNVVNPAIPALQSQVPTPPILGIARSGNSAVLFLAGEGALVVDLTNPSAPAIRGPIGVPGVSRDGSWVGDTLLVATGFALERFRVSPAATTVPALTIEFDRELLLPRATIRWTPVSLPGMVGLNLYRDLVTPAQGTATPAGTLMNQSLLSPTATEAVDDSLVPGCTCRYRLEAFFDDGSATKVAEGSIFVPSNSALGRPFPNPYRPNNGGRISLAFRIAPGAAGGLIEVTVHDVSGRLVHRSVQTVAAGGGFGSVTWDGRDGRGRKAPDGVYFVRVHGPGIDDARQFILLH